MTRKRANGEGNIKTRANGRYEARITVDGQRLSHYARTREEADRWLTQQKHNRDRGLPVTLDEKTPFGIYLSDWLVRVAPTIRASTHKRYRELAAHATKHLGSMPARAAHPRAPGTVLCDAHMLPPTARRSGRQRSTHRDFHWV